MFPLTSHVECFYWSSLLEDFVIFGFLHRKSFLRCDALSILNFLGCVVINFVWLSFFERLLAG